MRVRRKRKRSPLSEAIRLFICAVVSAGAAILIPIDSVSCSNDGFGQVCIHTIYTYNGLDAHTFKLILGAVAILCMAGSVYYFIRHNKAQAIQKSGAAFSASQPVVPQQPAMYPPPQNNYPGSYTGNAQPLPPWAAYPPPQNNYPGSHTGDAPPLPPSNEVPYNPYR